MWVLSEHEQRLLDQMERALGVEDPDLDASLSGRRLRVKRARLGAAVVIVLFGVVLLLAGVVVPVVWVGVLGFAVMVAGALSAFFGGGRSVECPGRVGLRARLGDRWRAHLEGPEDDGEGGGEGGLPARI